MTDIPEDDVRTMLAFSALNFAKQIKVSNDGLVSVLNNSVAQDLKSEEEHELARQAYLDTKSAFESLNELSQSFDESDEDERSVAEMFNPVVSSDTTEVSETQTTTHGNPTVEEEGSE